MASQNPTVPFLEPGDLLTADNAYQFQVQDIQNLVKFLWTGILLPADEATYKTRLNLPAIKSELAPLVGNLLISYGKVRLLVIPRPSIVYILS